jgi:hypothetical protein
VIEELLSDWESHNQKYVCQYAAEALERIGTPEAVKECDERSERVHLCAVRTKEKRKRVRT